MGVTLLTVHPRVVVASNEILSIKRSIKGEELKYLDLGCGDGSITELVAKKLGTSEVYGVDINAKILDKARSKGISIYRLDLCKDKLPFRDDYITLVTAFEVIEHLVNPDNMLLEVHRILKPGGFFFLSTPNLASWINRLYLLLGYQPLGVEGSTTVCVGQFTKWPPVGHVRAYTLRALKELLDFYGFKTLSIKGASTSGKMPKPFKLLDEIFSSMPSFARYIIIKTQKPPRS